MKKSFNFTMNVKVEVGKADDGRRIPWISFKVGSMVLFQKRAEWCV